MHKTKTDNEHGPDLYECTKTDTQTITPKKSPNHEKSHSENPTLDNYIPLAKVNGIQKSKQAY